MMDPLTRDEHAMLARVARAWPQDTDPDAWTTDEQCAHTIRERIRAGEQIPEG